jgi:pimeloyl-ACP methyl ester carboxylesterase
VTANFAAQGGQKMSHTHMTAPTQFLEAKGIRFAYRRFGKETGVPLVFMQHFRDGLDHWDPAITDGLGRDRPVVLFDNAGVAGSSGDTPDTIQGMGEYAIAFVRALDLHRSTSWDSRSEVMWRRRLLFNSRGSFGASCCLAPGRAAVCLCT